MLSEIIDSQTSELVKQLIFYSDLSPERFKAVWGKASYRIRRRYDFVKDINDQEIYEIVTGVLIQEENKGKRDAFGGAFRSDGSWDASLGVTPDYVDDLERGEEELGQSEEFEEVMNTLRGELTFESYSWLLNLVERRPEQIVHKLTGSPEEVLANIDAIRAQTELAARLYPEVGDIQRFHAQSMDKALETYVKGVYREVLIGERKRFPNHFFAENGDRKTRLLINDLIEGILELPISEVPSVVTMDFLRKHKLRTLVREHGKVFESVNVAYPKTFQPWEFGTTTRGYWQGEEGRVRAIDAVKYLFQKKLKVPVEQVPMVAKRKVFKEHGLEAMLSAQFNDVIYNAVNAAYPNQFHPWEMARAPKDYWTGEEGLKHAAMAMRWLVQDKLKTPLEDVPSVINQKEIFRYGLKGMLIQCFKGSPYRAVDNAYPGMFKIEQFQR